MHANTSQYRYSREHLLAAYSAGGSIDLPPNLNLVLAETVHGPVLDPTHAFTHNLGPEVNSRKPRVREAVPEWFEEEAKLPHNLTEEFSNIDLVVENKLKSTIIEPEETPEWEDPDYTPYDLTRETLQFAHKDVFEVSELSEFQNLPFASEILQRGLKEGPFVILEPHDKPHTPVWYYKDMQMQVHGPFSSVQMFNWVKKGFFPPNLLVSQAHDGPYWPMNHPSAPQSVNSEATETLKALLGLPF